MFVLVVAALLLAFLVPLANYFRDPKALRRFPAPSVAAFSPLWAVYHSWNGRRFLAVDEVHKRLGNVVRIGPENLSFSAPTAYKDIYGHGSNILKDTFYENLSGNTPSVADTTSRALHSDKRKNVSAIFSAKHVGTMEPKVIEAVERLLHAIQCKSEARTVSSADQYPVEKGQFDLRPWMNMFSFDAFSDMMWSSSYKFLARGSDDCPSMDVDGNVTTVNAMNSFQTGVHFAVICAQFSPTIYRAMRWISGGIFQKQAADQFTGMARYQTVQRLKSKPEGTDFFTQLPYETSDARRSVMELPELVAECTTFLNAGNDTTQISLTNTMFQLAWHPERQQELYEAIVKARSPDSGPILSYSELSNIQFLRACLDETFRLMPPVRFGLPRKTTAETTKISGHLIPAGVTVSSSVHTLHHDSTLFHSASEWKPERWLPDNHEVTAAEKQNLKDFVLPFTLGARACIGRNLAYMELTVCLSALIEHFEWTISSDAAAAFTHYERFNSSPVSLFVSAKARR